MTGAGTSKVAFASGGSFIRDTRREVEAYLADAGTRRRGLIELYAKAPLGLGLMAASWALLLFGPHPALLGLAAARRDGARHDDHRVLRAARRESRLVLRAAGASTT